MGDVQLMTGLIDEDPVVTPGEKADHTPYKRIGFVVGGKKMSVFDNKLPNFEDFKKGMVVDVEYTVSGKYNNIEKMTIADGMPPESAQSQQSPEPLQSMKQEEEKTKTASIVSQVIIKAVSDMVCAGKIELGHFSNSCLQLAEHYKATNKKILE